MSAPPELPEVVRRAFDVSRRAGYVSFCRNETGRLLAALAATRTGTLAEFGTGTGVGTAWLRSGVRGDAHILTAELDPELAGAAAQIFEDEPQLQSDVGEYERLEHHVDGVPDVPLLQPGLIAGVERSVAHHESGDHHCQHTRGV